MPLRFVAIIDRNNQPVYFQSAPNTPQNVAVNQQFIAEMSLDFVEQQSIQLQTRLNKPQLMMVHDGIAVYASLANTRTKYLIGVNSNVEPVQVDSVMKAVMDTYIGYQCNPFGIKSGMLKSDKFDRQIQEIITASQ